MLENKLFVILLFSAGLGFLGYKDCNFSTQDKNYSNPLEATIPQRIADKLYNQKDSCRYNN
jgi:hypothetical protein